MATLKSGLDYFPLNVDFFDNDKVQLVHTRFGLEAENIMIRLLCKIYSNSYFCRLTNDEVELFAWRIGGRTSGKRVNEIISELIKRQLFDKDIYNNYSILTSAAIQRRYLEATVRRKLVEMHEQLLLVEVPRQTNVIILSQDVCIISQNGDIIRQSKVKESKRKMENESEQAHICARPRTRGENDEDVHPGTKPDGWQDQPDYKRFLDWLKANAPFCSDRRNFPKQITENQFYKLKEKYTGSELADIIEQLENRRDLRQKYSNLYRTVLNWAKKEYGN